MEHNKFNIESITLKQYLQNKLNFDNEQCKSIINDLYKIQNKKNIEKNNYYYSCDLCDKPINIDNLIRCDKCGNLYCNECYEGYEHRDSNGKILDYELSHECDEEQNNHNFSINEIFHNIIKILEHYDCYDCDIIINDKFESKLINLNTLNKEYEKYTYAPNNINFVFKKYDKQYEKEYDIVIQFNYHTNSIDNIKEVNNCGNDLLHILELNIYKDYFKDLDIIECSNIGTIIDKEEFILNSIININLNNNIEPDFGLFI